jgi:hypothetical protein
VISLFPGRLRFLRHEFSTADSYGAHSQLFAGPNLAHRPVANHQNFRGRHCHLHLNLPECRFLGQEFVAIRIENAFDQRIAFQSQRSGLGVLNVGLTEADNEHADAFAMQKPEQGQRAPEQLQFSYGTMKVSFSSRMADCFRIASVEFSAHLSIDMPQHGVLTEGPQAFPVYGLNGRMETRFHHGSRGVTVADANALAEAIVERVIEVENHATDDRAFLAVFPVRLGYSVSTQSLCLGFQKRKRIVIAVTIEADGSRFARYCKAFDSAQVLFDFFSPVHSLPILTSCLWDSP